ncbi:hypothetical protein DDF67_18410 [Caulobacter endophyticus]|uniref:Alpha/beta hydrolase n=1 Tax=Caulobacter endophyticus TaxID=2172652 RepID=A0A2T9JMG2_9CAUL|nr:hypothetical protein DDF67_18410 [Caulobacter endophyticus]
MLLVRDPSDSWFHGVPGVEGGAEGFARRLAAYARGYSRVVCVGYSMGGYAALLFGRLLQADVTLSFAPQTVLTACGMARLADPRWRDHLDKVRALEAPRGLMDLKALFAETAASAARRRTSIYFPAAGDALDRLHARRLSDHADLVELGDDVAHSGFAIWLRRSGALRLLIDEAVGGIRGNLAGATDRYARWLDGLAYELWIDPPSQWGRAAGEVRVTGVVHKIGNGVLAVDGSSERPVRVGARRLSIDGRAPWPVEWRHDFDASALVPGGKYPFGLCFQSSQLPAGPNPISISLVKEHEFWFRDLGLPETVLVL